MIKRCLACGIEKDTEKLEVVREEIRKHMGLVEEPTLPLWELDCQPYDDISEEHSKWRRVTVCTECLYRLDPDHWISSDCWKSLEPVVKFEDLPLLS